LEALIERLVKLAEELTDPERVEKILGLAVRVAEIYARVKGL
jgi:hypothetical protein